MADCGGVYFSCFMCMSVGPTYNYGVCRSGQCIMCVHAASIIINEETDREKSKNEQ